QLARPSSGVSHLASASSWASQTSHILLHSDPAIRTPGAGRLQGGCEGRTGTTTGQGPDSERLFTKRRGKSEPTCRSEREKTGMTDHGRFVWYELTTTDIQSGQAFYSAVVGWGMRDASMPGMPYTVFTAGQDSVCGMMELPKEAREMGERPMWIGYVSVDDVDAIADRVKHLGGAVHVAPQD